MELRWSPQSLNLQLGSLWGHAWAPPCAVVWELIAVKWVIWGSPQFFHTPGVRAPRRLDLLWVLSVLWQVEGRGKGFHCTWAPPSPPDRLWSLTPPGRGAGPQQAPRTCRTHESSSAWIPPARSEAGGRRRPSAEGESCLSSVMLGQGALDWFSLPPQDLTACLCTPRLQQVRVSAVTSRSIRACAQTIRAGTPAGLYRPPSPPWARDKSSLKAAVIPAALTFT